MDGSNVSSRLVEYFIVVGVDVERGVLERADSGDGVLSLSGRSLGGDMAAAGQSLGATLGASGLSLASSDGVGAGAAAEAEQDTLFKTTVLDRYPVVDRPDCPFPNGVSVFCFPKGGAQLLKGIEMPRFYEFVSTGDNGTHLFGFVLTIFEPLPVRTHVNGGGGG
jgi:hypothetical protein